MERVKVRVTLWFEGYELSAHPSGRSIDVNRCRQRSTSPDDRRHVQSVWLPTLATTHITHASSVEPVAQGCHAGRGRFGGVILELARQTVHVNDVPVFPPDIHAWRRRPISRKPALV